MKSLHVDRLFPILKMTYEDQTSENAAKILLRCSLFLDARNLLVHIFRLIKCREESVEALKLMILNPDDYVLSRIPQEI